MAALHHLRADPASRRPDDIETGPSTLFPSTLGPLARRTIVNDDAYGRLDQEKRGKSVMRILHLGFEDHRRPGSGGGSRVNREINRRLAKKHRVTVLTASYPGARDRVEDGVRYIPTGVGTGYFSSIVSYFAALPFAVRRFECDLVVEDFGAPISSALVPFWTNRPLVGHVQWLHAREMARQYHVPFHLVESFGVPRYRQLIANSEDLANDLRRRNPTAAVHVVEPGIDRSLLAIEEPKGTDLVYIGRLETHGKGLDLLIDAFTMAKDRIDNQLLIVGGGRDRRKLEKLVESRGLLGRVEFTGRVSEEAKMSILRRAQLVLMPSRFETYGLVALEAHVAGTPVLAFDIPSLREHIPSDTGTSVRSFDATAYSEALATLANDPERCRQLGHLAREAARNMNWDRAAAEYESIYQHVVATAG